MSEKKALENYVSNLDKALGLVHDTDGIYFKTSLVNHKLDVIDRISELIDLVEEEIKGE
jgi:DNA polymerase elongation subunit (family B)